MVWNTTSPDGAQSVKANVTILQQNTTYTEQTLGNIVTQATKDHYWNVDPKSGHHRTVQMEDYAATYTGAPTSPALSDGMSLALFGLLNGSSVQAAAKNAGGIMQLLGIQGYAVFNNVAGNNPQTLISSFNITSVIRQVTGRFSLNFATALPNSNYLILGGGIGQTTGLTTPCTFSAASNAGTLGNKTPSQCIFLLYEGVGALNDTIQQGWVVCFGG